MPESNVVFDKEKVIGHLQSVFRCKIETVSILVDMKELRELQKERSRLEERMSRIELRARMDSKALSEKGKSGEKEDNRKSKMDFSMNFSTRNIEEIQKDLSVIQTKIEMASTSFRVKNILNYQRVLLITFSRQLDAKKTLNRSRNHRRFKVVYWFVFFLTFGFLKLKETLKKEQAEFFQQCHLAEGIDPNSVNWKYRNPSCLLWTLILIAYIFELLVYYFMISIYSKVFTSILDSESSFLSFNLVSYALILICKLSLQIIYIFTGFTLHLIRNSFINKSSRNGFLLFNYFMVQTITYLGLYIHVISSSEADDQKNPDQIIKDFYSSKALLPLVLLPVLRQFNFNLVKTWFLQVMITRRPNEFTQKDANNAFRPISHDTPLALSQIQLFLILLPIYLVTSPLLGIILGGVLILNFWIEKFLILRFYKRISHFDYTFMENGILGSMIFSVVAFLIYHPFFFLSILKKEEKESPLAILDDVKDDWFFRVYLVFYFLLFLFFFVLAYLYVFSKSKSTLQDRIWGRIQKTRSLMTSSFSSRRTSIHEEDYGSLREYFEKEYQDECPYDQFLRENYQANMLK